MPLNFITMSLTSWISSIRGVEAPEIWTKNLKISLRNDDFSRFVLAMVMQPLFDGLKKIEFYNENNPNSETVNRVVDFLNNNYNLIFLQMFNHGVVALKDNGKVISIVKNSNIQKEQVDGLYFVSNQSNYRMSETFQMFGVSEKQIYAQILDSLNLYFNAENTIIERLGQTTLFSADASNAEAKVLGETEKKALEDQLNGVLGSEDSTGKSVFVTKSGLTRNTIPFNLQNLNIVEKQKFALALMAGKMNIPEDLIPTLGSKTFNNVGEAKDYFKQNTINGWAEIMLELGRKCIRSSSELVASDALNFKLL